MHLAQAAGFELVFTGASEAVRRQLEQGGVGPSDGVVRFAPDLDRGLQRCEEGLLESAGVDAARPAGEALAAMPPGLRTYLERVSVPGGTVLIRQAESPDDVFVLESGTLRVETVTAEGTRMRLRTMHPGVVVGEVAMYTGVPRTADVVAETLSVVLQLTATSIARIEADDPGLAAALHRWLAATIAQRLGDTLRAFDALFD
jgi:SulP family sulfate permease